MKKIITLFTLTFILFSCKPTPPKEETTLKSPNSFAIVIHGGAGGIKRAYFTEEQQEAYTLKLEEAIEAGMTTMAIVTGRGKRAIEDHFDISYELEHQILGTSKEPLLKEIRDVITKCTFSYTRQVEMKGLGHAILTGGETLIGNEPFAVILADDLCDAKKGVLSQMCDLYKKYQCSIVAIEEYMHLQYM